MITPQRITDAYASTLEVIDFIVSRTSDSLADILTKALPLVAPIPNAVSIYYVSQTALSYNWIQALSVAASIECMFFALTEVVLKSWELWHADRQYKFPLIVSVIAFATYFVLVMLLVYMLEVTAGHSIAPMAFPVVSVVAAVALGVTRWHKRNGTKVTKLTTRSQTLTLTKPAQLSLSDDKPTATTDTDSDRSNNSETILTDKEKLSATDRRNHVADLLKTVTAVTDTIVADWANRFNVSDRTIRRDIQSLSASSGD